MIIATGLGNRDDAAFPGADQLNTGRDARRHMAFGFGAAGAAAAAVPG